MRSLTLFSNRLKKKSENYVDSVLDLILERQRQNEKDRVNRVVLSPVNSYLLIKRLIQDWELFVSKISKVSPEQLIQRVAAERGRRKSMYPNKNDLTMAAVGLMKLQDTYRLSVAQIAEGRIPGVTLSQHMSLDEVFGVGLVAYERKDFYHALTWFEEAFRLHRLGKSSEAGLTEIRILEFLAYVTYYQRNHQRAIALYRSLLELSPDHPVAFGNLHTFVNEMRNNGIVVPGMHANYEDYPVVNTRPSHAQPYMDAYEALCRGEYPISESQKFQRKTSSAGTNIPRIRTFCMLR